MRRPIVSLLTVFFLSFLAGNGSPARANAFDLQAAIDAAPAGAILQIPPGIYRGNFVIRQPITLEGIEWPVLDGNNQGHVIEIKGVPDVTIRGLIIRNSGARLDKEHAGIAVDKSPRLVVENNRLENTLFGVYIRSSNNSRIAGNVIGAKDLPLPARGDGIRVWYSNDSQVSGNRVDQGRDVVLWFNNRAVIKDNVITNGRYGLHFMYCDDSLVEHNRSEGNSVGAFLMYSRRLTLRHNVFANSRGPSGYGIGLKDMDGVEATDNLFTGNRVGMYFDNSPWSVDVSQHFQRNLFAYNDQGLLFSPSVKRNYFSQNSFIDNLEQVGLTGSGTFSGNGFTVAGQGNYWSDYAGYDATGDGLGDLPYVSKSLFENMMDKHPQLRLFQLSPAQQAVEMAARAFPIFQPQPKFSDEAPLLAPVIPAVSFPANGPVWPIWSVALGLLAMAAVTVATALRPTGGAGRPRWQAALALKSRLLVDDGRAEARPAFSPQNIGEPPMIRVRHLTKKFGAFAAVDDLSFDVAAGEAVALWGPNGAGKTTIIRSLLGLLSTEGTLAVDTFDVQKAGKRARAAIGYVPQELAFYDDLSTGDTTRFYARLKKAPSARVEEVLTEVGLTIQGSKPVGALSGGMKQRLALALALLAAPPVLLLDEPTSNLDARARDDFIKLLLEQKKQGKTLLFTSHRLEEVVALADRVLVIDNGKLALTCYDPAELAGRLGIQSRLRLAIPAAMRDGALALLQARGFSAARNGVGLRVVVSPTAKTAPLQALLAANIDVSDFDFENGL